MPDYKEPFAAVTTSADVSPKLWCEITGGSIMMISYLLYQTQVVNTMGWMTGSVPRSKSTGNGMPSFAPVQGASTSYTHEHAHTTASGNGSSSHGEQMPRKQLKRKNVDAFSQHYNFLKQKKLLVSCTKDRGNDGVFADSIRREVDDEQDMVAVGKCHWNVEELSGVAEDLDEVALTLVYSDGSTQLSKPKVGDGLCQNYQREIMSR